MVAGGKGCFGGDGLAGVEDREKGAERGGRGIDAPFEVGERTTRIPGTAANDDIGQSGDGSNDFTWFPSCLGGDFGEGTSGSRLLRLIDACFVVRTRSLVRH